MCCLLAGLLIQIALGRPMDVLAATNQATDPGGGGVLLSSSGLLTVNSKTLALVKQARDLSGNVLSNGAVVANGQQIYFILFVDNPTVAAATDIRLNDRINESQFTYVLNSIETTVVPAGSNDAAIWMGTWTARTDGVGGPDDIASITDSAAPAGLDQITIGAVSGQANQVLNIPGGSLRAIRFKVQVK